MSVDYNVNRNYNTKLLLLDFYRYNDDDSIKVADKQAADDNYIAVVVVRIVDKVLRLNIYVRCSLHRDRLFFNSSNYTVTIAEGIGRGNNVI